MKMLIRRGQEHNKAVYNFLNLKSRAPDRAYPIKLDAVFNSRISIMVKYFKRIGPLK